MKKLLIVLLALVLMLPIFGLAEESAIKDLSTENLLAIKLEVEQELARRDASSDSLIYPGSYEVGEDIAEGNYKFIFVNTSSTVSEIVTIDYFKNRDDYNEANKSGLSTKAVRENNGESYTIEPGVPIQLKLEPGNVFYIYYGTALVEKVNKPTWAN